MLPEKNVSVEAKIPAPRGGVIGNWVEPYATLPNAVILGCGVAVWVVVFGLWALASYGGGIDPVFLPTPGRVIAALVRFLGDGTLWMHMQASLVVVMTGFLISSLVALPIGLASGTFPALRAFLEPLVTFIRYLPVTSFIPLFILWIGIGLEQRVFVIFFGTFFAQLVMFAAAAQSVPRDLINAAYVLGTRRRDCLLHIVFPASLPAIFDALRVTIGWAWTYLVVAELVAADSGLGYISLKAMRGFQVEVIFMAIGVIGLLGLITDQIFKRAAIFLLPWTR